MESDQKHAETWGELTFSKKGIVFLTLFNLRQAPGSATKSD